MLPTKKDNDVYEDEGGLPWYLWLLMLVGVVAIVSLPNYTKEEEKPRENRVYQSKDLYDRIVEENP